jgi:hypothetical protein
MVDRRKREARARAAETGESYTRANRTVARAMDRDVRFLLDLLAMLPAMTGDRATARHIWWQTYASVHAKQWDGGYYAKSLAPFAGRLLRGEGDDEDVRRLAEYCLMFFDVADRPECCQELDVVLGNFSPGTDPGVIGRRWAMSVCDVAWRLYAPRESRLLVRDGRGAWPPIGE